MSSVTSARSRKANAAKRAKQDPTAENLQAMRDESRDYAAENLAAHIKRIVDAAPPLTAEQRGRLQQLLQGGGC